MGLDLNNLLTVQDADVGKMLASYDSKLTDILKGLTIDEETDPDISVQFGDLNIDFKYGQEIGNDDMYYINAITERINLATKVLTTAGAAPAKAMQTTIDKYNQQG